MLKTPYTTHMSSFCHVFVLTACGLLVGCAHPLQENWQSFRAAKKRGDTETAAKYLAEDARIWFGKKEGPGRPLTVEGGPYKHWDKEFRSTSTREKMRVRGNTLSYISPEHNDFYRLIDGAMGKARITYFFNDDGKITGMLYGSLPTKGPPIPNRRGEFKEWAAKRYPGVLDSAEMKIPNNPKRWRELLVEWRADVGLPAIE